MVQTKQRKWHYAFFILIMTGLLLGFSRGGLMNSGGLFLTPVANDLNVNMGVLTIYFSISSLVLMLALPILGRFIGKINIKTLIIASVILQGGIFACFGLLSNVWGFYILSIPMAIGTAIPCHILGPVIVNSWFKKNTGLAMGVMMAISGGVSAILQPQITSLIVNVGWRNAYWITGVIGVAVVAIIALLFIRLPDKKGSLPYGVQAVVEQGNQNASEQPNTHVEQGISVKSAKKSISLYALVIFMLLLTAIASFSQLISSFVVSNGFDLSFGGTSMSLQMIGALIGALFFGALSDKIGAKISVLIALSFGVAAFTLLLITPTSSVMVMISMVLFGFMTASMGTMGPLLVSDVFGRKNYAAIYSIVAMGLAIGSMIGTPLFGFLYSAFNSYIPVIVLLLAMIGLCAGMIFIAYAFKKHMWKKEAQLEEKEQVLSEPMILNPEMAE